MNTPCAPLNENDNDDKRPSCRYGTNCYQKNISHRRKFKHPSPEEKDTISEPADRKRKTPDDKDSIDNDTPQSKKQSTCPEETQEADNNINSSVEQPDDVSSGQQTEKVPDSTEEQTENVADSNDQQTEEIPDSTEEQTENVADSNEQQTEKLPDSTEEQTEKVADSSAQQDEEGLESIEPQEEKAVEMPQVTQSIPRNVSSPNALVKDAKEPNIHNEPSKLIRKIFLVNMPNDFYQFYDLCSAIRPNDPTSAFEIADLKLVGPYDVLAGEINSDTPDQDKLLTHWRYYYDPPEFQTVIKGNDREGLHFGYWRDRPSSDPIFVANNVLNVSHKIKPTAENIFGAVAIYMEERSKKATPFEMTSFSSLLGKLKAFAKKHNISLEAQTPKMKAREKNVVARTIHGAGIVCPYNKKTQVGYRELSITDNQLLKIVKKIEDAHDDEDRAGPRAELGEVVRLATIAGDECDFGTCLELGHDLFSTGCVHVQNAALAVLSIAYSQLERTEFLTIFEAHMKDRKKGCNCSALSSRKSIESS